MTSGEPHPVVSALQNKVTTLSDYIARDTNDQYGAERIEATLAEHDAADLLELIADLKADNEDLRHRVDQLEERLDTTEDAVHTSGKQGKVRDLVRAAQNRRNGGEDVVMMDYKDIKAATGVSKRYAFDLMDDLPGQFACFEDGDDVGQYGSAEINKTEGSRRLAVLIEQVHDEDGLVNKFNTRFGSEGGEA